MKGFYMKPTIVSLVLLSGLTMGVVCFAGKVNISGVDKAGLLRGLFYRAKPQGLGFLQVRYCESLLTDNPEPRDLLSDSDVEQILERGYVDYLKGRVMKIDISGDSVDTFLYNRDNGEDAAEEIIEGFRQ